MNEEPRTHPRIVEVTGMGSSTPNARPFARYAAEVGQQSIEAFQRARGGNPHTHTSIVPGCVRCELHEDEVQSDRERLIGDLGAVAALSDSVVDVICAVEAAHVVPVESTDLLCDLTDRVDYMVPELGLARRKLAAIRALVDEGFTEAGSYFNRGFNGEPISPPRVDACALRAILDGA